MNGVDLNTFDASRAITLRQAISSGKLNLRGKMPSLPILQRWANPRCGCRPLGKDGPVLIFPTVATARLRLTMPEWVDWFVKQRVAIIVDGSKRLVIPPTDAEVKERAHAAMRRMGRPIRE